MKNFASPKLGMPVLNASGMPIPPRSVVVVVGVSFSDPTATQEGQLITLVDQYGCGKSGAIMVTGSATIPAGRQGVAYYDSVLFVAIDGGTPVSGEEWGPTDGSWLLSKTDDTKGFIAHGYASMGESPRMGIFARTFIREPASECSSLSSSSESSASDSGSGSGSASGSGSTSAPCGCITVVTSASCTSGGGLSVTYGSARGCC